MPVIAILALALGACSPTRPPTDDMGIATRNLAAARAAGAGTYAPLELRFAEEKLDQAQSAMTGEDFDAAVVFASESSVNSELAVAKSRLGKAREAVDAMKQRNQALKQDAARHAQGAGFQ